MSRQWPETKNYNSPSYHGPVMNENQQTVWFATLSAYSRIYDATTADLIFQQLQQRLQFVPRDHPALQFEIYGKSHSLARDKAFWNETGREQYIYSRSGSADDEEKKLPVSLFSDTKSAGWDLITAIWQDAKRFSGEQRLNHLVINQYQDGDDYIGFHHDKTKTFVPDTPIVTVSFGAERLLEMRRDWGSGSTLRLEPDIQLRLESGTMYIISYQDNDLYKHRIKKQPRITGSRISLTFRCIKAAAAAS